ncbi:STI1-like protein isoform X2 [Schistocerca gregaria]|uniref:STI1-like protein isoform X2 n=1 Tax=Schistocerca gregaria TaxID=7010 RepID=UPI00211E9569|nr:STI1-like protein isoform X2 [Schistocerca gregaria]
MDQKEEAQQHKEKGNDCVKEKKYIEAVLHYTNAIKLDSSDHTFYSNRSLAFLKQQQYPLAMEDARQAIKLKPDWPKGYFRKGEIELATGHYTEALLSYGCALRLQPHDKSILDAISKTTEMRQKERQADFQIPWLGAGIGIIIGVGLVIADYLLTDKPSIKIVQIKIMNKNPRKMESQNGVIGIRKLKLANDLRKEEVENLLALLISKFYRVEETSYQQMMGHGMSIYPS